ncbi:hypothetical protein BN961_00924 [Afipia felis]|jgi:hypothetical protein|uniref:Uncharacterized protein n=1 Tax=Afipia felis TaxID=1035 RepID=A0A090MML5_AFIFE|nr:hypothetical protein [Afipia felis]MBE0705128.1 hypothetical protein [Afipia sp.]CEG07532.1 hypothetical protein BN961_00924 [Afipia felis]
MLDMTTKELQSRYVKPEEALRLGVVSGWYTTKISGTFVTGPHATQAEAALKIKELNPPPVPVAKRNMGAAHSTPVVAK